MHLLISLFRATRLRYVLWINGHLKNPIIRKKGNRYEMNFPTYELEEIPVTDEMETDCVSRSFCPKLSIPEDPVCGSAHCQIADYWSSVLNKKEIDAYQASKRGGYLHCELLDNGRIAISGEAALVAISDIKVDL